MDQNSRLNKGPNEKFCTECGKIINSKAEICPHCGVRQPTATSESSSILKKILKVVLIVFLILMVIGFVVELMEDDTTDSQQSSNAISSSEPVIEVSPHQIFADYNSNEVAADQKYKDKLLKVTGTVESIDSDILDEAVVELEAGGFLETVSVEGGSDFTDTAATLSKGQQVTVVCRGAGEILGFPMLDKCVFQ